MTRGRRRLLVAVAAVLASALVVVLLDRYVVRAVVVSSTSMEPTLVVGDRLLVDRRTDPASLRVGDLVVVDSPWGERAEIVKRVLGIPGQTVACCTDTGAVTIDGAPLAEPWLAAGVRPSTITFSVTVTPEHLWLMGDSRDGSDDSRRHLGDPGGGLVGFDRVVGKVWMRYWPTQGLGQLASASSGIPGAMTDG